MRRSLLLYLFCFAVLIAIFQYVSSRKMLETKNEEIKDLKEQLTFEKNRNDSLETSAASPELFRFESNDAAMTYFQERGYEGEEVLRMVEDEIIGRNKADADNELIPFEGMNGHMRVNTIRILNNKWILANFTDGVYWGELFLTYYIDEEGNLTVETETAMLYPMN